VIWLRRALVALTVIALATLLRWLLEPLLPEAVPFITFFAAVAAVTWLGGLWTGIAATIICTVIADWLFIPPLYALDLFRHGPTSAQSAVFIVMSGILIVLTEGLRRAIDRGDAALQAAAEARRTVEVTLTSIGDGVIATDIQGRVTFLNPVAESLTGWKLAEASGRLLTDVFRIVNEQTRNIVENPCERVLRTGRVVGLANHTLLLARDGREYPIDDSAAPITDDAGNLRGVILVFRDATHERSAQDAAQRLGAIVEHSDDAIIGAARDARITSWNVGAERLYGYAAAEAVGQDIRLIVPTERLAEVETNIDLLVSGRPVPPWDTVRRRKDGSLVDVSIQVSPIRNADGELTGASIVARDITLRRRQEEALRFLAETSVTLAAITDRHSALSHAASAAVPFFADWCVVLTVDDHGRIEHQAFVHRDAEQQQVLADALQQYVLDWNSASISVEALRSGRTQFVSELSQTLLERIAQDAGTAESLHRLKPQSVISVPLQIRGRMVGAISFAMAVGSRRYTSEDVRLAEDLARRVAIAMDNADLLNSLRVADRQKDEFLAMLAHELRNPLAAIQYAADVAGLQASQIDAELLDIVRRQVQHLTRMIDDLLDLSRISRNQIQLRKEPVDASVLARRALATVRPLVDSKQHRVSLDLCDTPLPLNVDATRIEQVIGNLLTNAAKYTADGGQIAVSTSAEGSEAVIRVRDTGVGISRDVLPHVFELFAQAATSLDRSQGGLGIGLTVARKLVEVHGGTIAAASDGVGKGAEFIVRIPLSHQALDSTAASAMPPVGAGDRLRVLIVEDNRDAARMEMLLIQQFGHEVAVAHDGPSGIDLARTFQPDAMLIDIGLPGLNGYEVAARLRSEGFHAVTLIAVSGYGQPQDQRRSREAGFNAHLVKPVGGDALVSALKGARSTSPAPA